MFSRYIKSGILFTGLALGVAACMSGGTLKDSSHTSLTPSQSQALFAGNTQLWDDGGVHYGANGNVQEAGSGLGIGKWSIKANGNVCRMVYYLDDEGSGKFYPASEGELCTWLSRDQDGAIWINDNSWEPDSARNDDWWILVESDGTNDRLVAGNTIISETNALLAGKTPFPDAVAAIPSLKPITTREEFVAQMIGKKLWYQADGYLIKSADGTYTAFQDGQEFVADWEWKNGMMCRTFRHNGKTDCKRFLGNGTYFQVFNKNGEGSFEFYSTRR